MKLFFRYFFRALRIILGPFMRLSEWLSSPNGIERSVEAQWLYESDDINAWLHKRFAPGENCPQAS